jgi:Cys-rich repeat protein
MDSQCKSDAGTNGRCRYSTGGAIFCSCSYDSCLHDTDCPSGDTCACHGSPFVAGGNFCIKSGCRVDSDCGAGGYCSPAYNTGSCGSLLGYYCHTPKDQCVNDSDCVGDGGGLPEKCSYSTSSGYWMCMKYGLCA